MSETLAAPARFELELKKSRFLASAAPVESPEAALAWLGTASVRDATHNCWAYRIGQQYRFSDDGEPSGTAGRPILAAIDGQGVDRVVALVTRWYGGIKLGAGGLVRAYGGSAAECLRQAARRAIVALVAVRVHCDFAQSGVVHALLVAHAATRIDERFEADGLHLHLQLAATALPDFERALRDATRGRATMAILPPAAT